MTINNHDALKIFTGTCNGTDVERVHLIGAGYYVQVKYWRKGATADKALWVTVERAGDTIIDPSVGDAANSGAERSPLESGDIAVYRLTRDGSTGGYVRLFGEAALTYTVEAIPADYKPI